MIVDANGYLGRWGLRTHGIAAREFIEEMDRNGIELSVVTSTVALITDTREGNSRLLEEVAPHRERLIPAACLNPVWGLEEARGYFGRDGCVVARFSPSLHNYSLGDEGLLEPFVRWLEDEAIPLYITSDVCYDFGGLADIMGFAPPVYPAQEIIGFAERHPNLKIVACGLSCQTACELHNTLIPGLRGNGNLYVEISNIFTSGTIDLLAMEVPGQVLLGTGGGINYMSAALGKVLLGGISPENRSRILGSNIREILKLEDA